MVARIASAGALAATLGACAAVSGLDAFSKRSCEGGCADGLDSGSLPDASSAADTGDVALVLEASPPRDGDMDGREGGSSADGACGNVASACDASCALGCPDSAAPHYACSVGGCNASNGGCLAAGQRCYCFEDTQCISGKCVAVAGQNDVACGSLCTGSGGTDSIDCLAASPGIPSLAPAAFPYAPTNFDPSAFAPPATSTTIDCDTTYDASLHTFSGWCAGRTAPTIAAGVAQAGGPPLDVLAFRGLVLVSGHTLNIVATGAGASAVVLAVYGTADIQGSIHADGNDGVSGTSTAGLSGAGGNFSCAGATGTSQPNDGHCSGGAGAGASSTGGNGAGGVGGNAAAGGSARANAALQPLFGGCPGGTSGSFACRTSGGGGGGAVQISASGQLLVSGAITANGGDGGTSTCSATACIPQSVYGGGGGGAGSGGAILLEAQNVVTTGSTITVNGGTGGFPNTGSANGGQGGAGGASASPAGAPGTGATNNNCGPSSLCAGGGGGAYGYLKIDAPGPALCATTLAPAPVPDALLTACLCVADIDCSSGKCVNAGTRCTGTCTGSGAADEFGCQALTSK